MENDHRIEQILFLQRLIRSFYVRRQFEQVRKEYLKTLSDIEGEISVKSVEIIPTKPEPVPQTGRINECLKFHFDYIFQLLFLQVKTNYYENVKN